MRSARQCPKTVISASQNGVNGLQVGPERFSTQQEKKSEFEMDYHFASTFSPRFHKLFTLGMYQSNTGIGYQSRYQKKYNIGYPILNWY